MSNWYVEVDMLKEMPRPQAPWLYWRARYWHTEADFLAGLPPVVSNDFIAGDMLRWVGQTKLEKRIRFDGPDPLGEFYCEGSSIEYGSFDHPEHWVSGALKYGVNEQNQRVRNHFPKKFVVGVYTENDVTTWVLEQSDDWIALHPTATGDRTDRRFAIEDPTANAVLPAAVRALAGGRSVEVTDGVSKRQQRIEMVGRDVTGMPELQ